MSEDFLESIFGRLSANKLKRIRKILTRVYERKYRRSREPKYGNMNKGFTEGELQKFLACLKNKKAMLAFQLVAYLGLRVGEAARVKLEDINFDEKTLRVPTEKSGKVDYLPLHDRIYFPLLEWVRMHGNSIASSDGYLLFAGDKRRIASGVKHVSEDWLRNEFREACKQAGLDEVYAEAEDEANPVQSKRGRRKLHRLTTHSLRHYFITKTYQSTLDPVVTSKLARHSNVSITTGTYVHTMPERLAEGISKAFEATGWAFTQERKNELQEFLEFYLMWRKSKT